MWWSHSRTVTVVSRGGRLRLSVVERVLQSHVGKDDASCQAALRSRAAQTLKVLVHAILPECCLDGSRCSSTHKITSIFLLQHLHLNSDSDFVCFNLL